MVIGIDYRNVQAGSYRAYCAELLLLPAISHFPQHRFVFLYDGAAPAQFKYDNVSFHVFKKPAGFIASSAWWQKKMFASFIKKYSPQTWLVFDNGMQLHFSGSQMIILCETVPVLPTGVANNITVAYTTPWLKNSCSIRNPDYKGGTVELYGIYKKIRPPALPTPYKDSITDGKEYFLCTDFNLPESALVLLLKSFSIFKNRQQSNWKLVFAARSKAAKMHIEHTLKNYKYKADVVVAEAANIPPLLGEAYALLSVNTLEIFPAPVFEAHQAHAPVLATHTQTLQETTGAALLIAPDATPEAFAEEMMFLYKDENYKKILQQHIPSILAAYPAMQAQRAFEALLMQAG